MSVADNGTSHPVFEISIGGTSTPVSQLQDELHGATTTSEAAQDLASCVLDRTLSTSESKAVQSQTMAGMTPLHKILANVAKKTEEM